MIFDGTQKTIGKGSQADVVSYYGYAYKIYKKNYPLEWIKFEKKQQEFVNKAGFSDVKYYDTDDTHILKMDLISGVTLENVASKGDLNVWDILRNAFEFVHGKNVDGLDFPSFIDTAAIGLCEDDKITILPIIERLSKKMENRVCHLDLHFLNIMIPECGKNFQIIDWINARLAPMVFDYARTYVIFEEFSKIGLDMYIKNVLPQMWNLGVSEDDFYDAIKVSRIIRQAEKAN